jgi:hypothetical protein
VEFWVSKKLALKLKGGLLRGQQEKRRAIGRRNQFTADFREAAKSLAATGRAEEEARVHHRMFSTNRIGGKEFLQEGEGKRWQNGVDSCAFQAGTTPIFLKIFVDYLCSFVKVAPPVEWKCSPGRNI